jgi:hypothetical protein
MEKKAVITETPFKIDGLTVIPVVRISLDDRTYGKRNIAFGSRQPVAVIFSTGAKKKVLRITGEEISLEKLMEEFPDLNNFITL